MGMMMMGMMMMGKVIIKVMTLIALMIMKEVVM